MNKPHVSNTARNASHLRLAIDSGATADKVPAADPAAAPLGTDDEAAGTPPTRRQVERSLRQEVSPASTRPSPDRGGLWLWTAAAVLLIIVAAVAATVAS
jgi:hypothetical protein